MKKLYTNARFTTMGNEGDTAAALLTEGDRILALYSLEEDIPLSLEAERIDLKGAAVYPGFVDTHTHAFEGGLYSICVDLGACRRIDEVLEQLAEADPVGGLVIGWNLDTFALAEGRFPSREELDRVQPDLPLLLRRIDGHSSAVNSAAAERIPWPGELPASNEPLVSDQNRAATAWFHAAVDEEGILAAYAAASNIALAAGLTGVHAMIGNGASDPRHYRLIRDNLSSFDVAFTLYPQIRDIPTALELGAERIGGCVLADGSIGSYTAALKAPYADRPETGGALYESDDHWYAFVKAAHEAGLAACIHAIGDAAVTQIARIMSRVYHEDPKSLPHQIIHAEMCDDETLSLLKGTPVCGVMQPAFDALWGGKQGLYRERLGEERMQLCNRYRSMSNAGILLSGSSDWYITPLDPVGGIRAALNLHNPAEALSPFEALSLFTRNAAALINRSGDEGVLAPGKPCDLSLLSGPVEEAGSRVVGVIRRGRYYSADS